MEYSERRYLERPPGPEELGAVLEALGMEPWELTRLGEPAAREAGMRDWPRERARWIAALCAAPALIERPLLVTGDGRAALGRPPEAILPLLG